MPVGRSTCQGMTWSDDACFVLPLGGGCSAGAYEACTLHLIICDLQVVQVPRTRRRRFEGVMKRCLACDVCMTDPDTSSCLCQQVVEHKEHW